jgi:hypothetical protein
LKIIFLPNQRYKLIILLDNTANKPCKIIQGDILLSCVFYFEKFTNEQGRGNVKLFAAVQDAKLDLRFDTQHILTFPGIHEYIYIVN